MYSGKPAAPVVFSTPGVVELGCNIHDWMLAYVVVVDTPYHAITDARGQVTAYVYDDRGLRLYYSGFGEVRQAVRYATSFTASDATTTADLDTTFGAETAAPPARRLVRARARQ